MAAYTTIPAWRIPWTEEPGRLQGVAIELDMTGRPHGSKGRKGQLSTQRGRRAAENWTEHDFFLAGRRWRRGPQGGFLLNSLAQTLALGHSLLFHLLINKSLSQPVCVHWGRVCVG